ncbi:protein kinase dsk1 [Chaetomidium leptoderma]|uniref:non-specific serine/threonine protein kinase n=1 Tax=Chaetomidium leptoderma TaxID=669021 RepID=A0AAN6VKD2_9PEZI|nr:protein kinase dsk1 [Chaetomidium leptoderma]
MANNTKRRPEKVYFPNIDVENLEEYRIGGYHPTVIGDAFHEGRYKVAHKLGFGGSSTIWLARDRHLQRYVSLKILMARQATESNEAKILRLLSGCSSESTHSGQGFIPRLLDDFTIDGPNGRHLCLVQEFAACSITVAKEWSSNNMFPVETARSIAAQLILGLSYLHSRGVSHGDLHMQNFIYGLNIDHLSPDELYSRYHFDTAPVRRVNGAAPEPHAPPYAVWSMPIKTPADKLVDPIIKISDYGTSFVTADNPSPQLCTPTLYRPPEALFDDRIIPFAADIWTFGVNLYEVLGERPLFETFTWDRDDILADIISTLGLPPQRWWDAWANRGEFFERDGEWRKGGIISRIYDPVWRPLSQRMWDMGRGEKPEGCEWDVEGGEMRALEDLFRGVLAWEPNERWTAEDLVGSEYMVRWALPAWERQRRRQGEEASPA